jgi:hypothetical protein
LNIFVVNQNLYEIIKKSWDTNNGGYNLKFWYNPSYFGIDGDLNICRYFNNVVCKHGFKYDKNVNIENFAIGNNNNNNSYYKDINRRNKKQRTVDLLL